ncbi:MAG: T9SS type A sorting domain-containing protein [Flavobacteriales bacterium]|nr:T9SS type A sorting domain-containing protein [Flavobacteriales bacterium]MCB9363732.1 T9SS type A sorting domain-containing protein [Flavobacteriales bacterium]
MKKAIKQITALVLLSVITIAGFSQNNNAFRFRINGNGFTDETIVRLVNGASQEFDGSYDAWKFFSPNPSVPSIYTQIEEGQELSINSLPEFDEDVSITLYTNIPVSGTYTLDIEEVFALSSNYKVSISNIESNTDFLFLGDTALSFIFNEQQNAPTFTFNISSEAIISSEDESCISMKNGALNVDNKGNNDWAIEIKDEAGLTVVNEISTTPVYNFDNLAAGNYIAIVSSKGIVDSYNFTINPGIAVSADFDMSEDTLYLDEGAELFLTNNSQNAVNNNWSFGDGDVSDQVDPIHSYGLAGTYDVTLSVTNDNCLVEKTKQVVIYKMRSLVTEGGITTSVESFELNKASITSLGNGNYTINTPNIETKQVRVFDLKGNLVFEDVFSNNNYSFSLAKNSSGMYVANIVSENGQVLQNKIMR